MSFPEPKTPEEKQAFAESIDREVENDTRSMISWAQQSMKESMVNWTLADAIAAFEFLDAR